MRVVVQRVLESLGRAPRVAATVRHGHTPASLLISRLQASARQNDLTPTTTLWPRRSSVCARPYPSERKGPWRDLGRVEYAALEYVDWFSHRRPRPPKPNASPCLPPPSPPGTPPTSVQLLTTVYQHINLHRRYDVTNTTTPPPGQLRPLTAAQTDAFCTDAGSTPDSEPGGSTGGRFRWVAAPPPRRVGAVGGPELFGREHGCRCLQLLPGACVDPGTDGRFPVPTVCSEEIRWPICCSRHATSSTTPASGPTDPPALVARDDRGPPGITATTRMHPSGDAIPKLFALAPGRVLWWFPGSGSRR